MLFACYNFIYLYILGQAFTIMLVYVWARRNPMVRMNFFGLLTFQAPYLPWVLLGFSLLLGNSVSVDLLGMAVGHIYYFLEDVFPNQPGGKRLLQTPAFLQVNWGSAKFTLLIRNSFIRAHIRGKNMILYYFSGNFWWWTWRPQL